MARTQCWPGWSRGSPRRKLHAEAYRGRNLEICNLNDTLHGLGGLLIEPAPPEPEPAMAPWPVDAKRCGPNFWTTSPEIGTCRSSKVGSMTVMKGLDAGSRSFATVWACPGPFLWAPAPSMQWLIPGPEQNPKVLPHSSVVCAVSSRLAEFEIWPSRAGLSLTYPKLDTSSIGFLVAGLEPWNFEWLSVGNGIIIPTVTKTPWFFRGVGRKTTNQFWLLNQPSSPKQWVFRSSCVSWIGSLRYLAGVPVQAAWACYLCIIWLWHVATQKDCCWIMLILHPILNFIIV